MPPSRRTARFATVAIARWTVERCITAEPRGAGGFGYDRWLFPTKSMVAQMLPEEKDACSHRGGVVRALIAGLWVLLGDC